MTMKTTICAFVILFMAFTLGLMFVTACGRSSSVESSGPDTGDGRDAEQECPVRSLRELLARPKRLGRPERLTAAQAMDELSRSRPKDPELARVLLEAQWLKYDPRHDRPGPNLRSGEALPPLLPRSPATRGLIAMDGAVVMAEVTAWLCERSDADLDSGIKLMLGLVVTAHADSGVDVGGYLSVKKDHASVAAFIDFLGTNAKLMRDILKRYYDGVHQL